MNFRKMISAFAIAAMAMTTVFTTSCKKDNGGDSNLTGKVSVKVSSRTDVSVTADFSAAGSDKYYYNIAAKDGFNESEIIAKVSGSMSDAEISKNIVSGKKTGIKFEGLTAATDYYVYAFVIDAKGNTGKMTRVPVTTAPAFQENFDGTVEVKGYGSFIMKINVKPGETTENFWVSAIPSKNYDASKKREIIEAAYRSIFESNPTMTEEDIKKQILSSDEADYQLPGLSADTEYLPVVCAVDYESNMIYSIHVGEAVKTPALSTEMEATVTEVTRHTFEELRTAFDAYIKTEPAADLKKYAENLLKSFYDQSGAPVSDNDWASLLPKTEITKGNPGTVQTILGGLDFEKYFASQETGEVMYDAVAYESLFAGILFDSPLQSMFNAGYLFLTAPFEAQTSDGSMVDMYVSFGAVPYEYTVDFSQEVTAEAFMEVAYHAIGVPTITKKYIVKDIKVETPITTDMVANWVSYEIPGNNSEAAAARLASVASENAVVRSLEVPSVFVK